MKTLGKIRDLMDIDGKAFYFRLTLALRGYVEGKYSVNAAEMTTEELAPVLKSLRIDEELETGALCLFDYSDPVKYADAVAERAKMENHFKFVRYFVKSTAENSFRQDASPGEARVATGNDLAEGNSESA